MRIIKKTIAALTSTMLLASVLPVSSSAAVGYPEASETKLGDVNNNGTINNDDFNALKKYMLGYSNTGATPKSADLTQDGVVNSADLVCMMQILSLNLHCVDNIYSKYKFTYNGKEYTAEYTTDNWKIRNSYEITEMSDMVLICSLLKDRHPIHNKNYTGWRTAENMANEWDAHNFAYCVDLFGLWHNHTKDVDIDPTGDGMKA